MPKKYRDWSRIPLTKKEKRNWTFVRGALKAELTPSGRDYMTGEVSYTITVYIQMDAGKNLGWAFLTHYYRSGYNAHLFAQKFVSDGLCPPR